MILRNIQVSGWKCFAEPLTVGPFGDGLNLIYAPNGRGKSTLVWAVVRALFDNHKVSGEAVGDLRPWGRDLNPSATIEFEHEGVGYRMAKQFLGSQQATLSRRENGKFTPLAEADAATEHVRQMFHAGKPSRGLTDPADWGLVQVLWAPQGGLAVSSINATTLDRIRTSLGAQVAGPGTQPILDRIEQTYGKVYTAGGKFRRGAGAPPIVALEEQLTEANAGRAKLVGDIEGFESSSRRIEELRGAAAQSRLNEEALAAQLAQCHERDRAYQKLLAQRSEQQAKAEAAEAQHGKLHAQIAALKQAREASTRQRSELSQLQLSAPSQAQEAERARAEAERTAAALQALKQGRAKLDEADRRQQRAAAFLKLQAGLTAADEMLTKVAAAQAELTAALQRRTQIVAPDRATLQKIRAAATERDDAQRNLDASLITMHITPERPLDVTVVSGEQPGPASLPKDVVTQLKGSPEVTIRIEGVGTIRATGPQGNVEEWRDKLAGSRQKLEKLAATFGSRDVEHLQRLTDQAEELDALVKQHESRIEALLGGENAEAASQRRAAIAVQLAEISQAEPDWQATPPDADALAEAALAARHENRLAEDNATARWQAAESAAQSAQTKHQSMLKDIGTLEKALADAEKKIAELTSDELDDAQRAEALKQHSRAMVLAQTSLEMAAEALKEFGGDPRQELEQLGKRLEAVRQATAKASEAFIRVESELQRYASIGPYSALAQADETIAKLSAAIERENLANAGIQLLHTTVGDCRREAVSAVAGPVQSRATLTLERIAGPRFCEVGFDENFQLAGVAPRIASGPVDVVRLSGGEQEQVHFAVRLALADVVAGEGRQLLVLDDALVNTDDGRMTRIHTILREAAAKFQVLILSCHPAAYFGLVDEAHRFNLEELATK